MSNIKTLNLDQLADVALTVTFGGETYPVVAMSVAQFIESSTASERLKNEKDTAKQVAEMVNVVARAIPSCPREKLLTMSIEQLFAILEFITDTQKEGASEDAGKSAETQESSQTQK